MIVLEVKIAHGERHLAREIHAFSSHKFPHFEKFDFLLQQADKVIFQLSSKIFWSTAYHVCQQVKLGARLALSLRST